MSDRNEVVAFQKKKKKKKKGGGQHKKAPPLSVVVVPHACDDVVEVHDCTEKELYMYLCIEVVEGRNFQFRSVEQVVLIVAVTSGTLEIHAGGLAWTAKRCYPRSSGRGHGLFLKVLSASVECKWRPPGRGS